MEWFIMGRDMHVLCNPSTDAPKSLQIYDDKQTNVISNNTVVSTYDFTISKQHKDATKVQLGGYIVFVDKYRKTKMYTLMSYDGDDITQTWHAEDIGLDLLNESSEKWTEKEPHPIAWYLENRVIGDSGWTIGINEIPQLSRTLSFDGESDTQLTRLGDIANQFDGAEIDFSIEMRGSQVTQQHVNIYKKIGSNVIQDRYVDSVNLISLHSTGTIESLTTALKPFGSEMEVPEGSPEGTEASRVTLYNVNYDDGRYYSPWGHIYLYDRQARQQWSRFNQYNSATAGEFDGYIVGSYSYDTLDENELLNRSLTQLKKQNTPQETFEAQLSDINADIGDYVQIAHSEYNPPLYLKARVEQVENSYTQDGADTGVLGDYTHLQSQIDPRVKDLLNDLENKMKFNYTWIRYASDDKGSDMTSFPTTDTKYVAIIPNKQSGVPSDDPKDYEGKWQLIAGIDGKDGVAGEKGADGRTSYTHFAYANDVSGTTDFSLDDPTGRSYMGVYSDFTKADSTNPDDYIWSFTKGETGPEGMQGAQGPKGDVGIPGKPGIDGKTPYTHVAYADNDEGGGFSQSPDNKAYMGWYSDFTEIDSNDPSLYGWSLIKGADGKDGADGVAGKDGVGVTATTITYTQSTSGTTPPTTGWTASVPTLIKGQYLWTRTVWTYTDSSTETGYTVSYNAKDGNNGSDGVAGKDGVGISNTIIEYVGAVSGTSKPASGWSTTIPAVPAGQYLWTRTTWKYTDGTSEQGFTNALMGRTGAAGRDGVAGKDGIGIKSTVVSYQASTNGTTAPTGTWSTTVPTVAKGSYLWTRTIWTYTDNTTETGYSVAYVGTNGNDGTNGVAGKDGVGIRSTAITYTTSASGTSAPTSGWVSTPPPATAGQFIWTRTIWTYTDNTTETGYSVGKIGEKGATGRDGSNGAPGRPGADGRTPYFHQAWADSKDGKVNFNTTDPTNRGYLGTYSDFTQADSTDPTKYRWIELVGALEIGGRNYLADTGSPWQAQGSGGANQGSSWQFTFGGIKQAPFNDGEYVTVSFDYTSVGTGAYGTILTQFNNPPWTQFGATEAMKDNGHVVRTVQWQSSWATNSTATGIHVRVDNVATTRTVTVYNMQFESGNKATDHKVAPEDTQAIIDSLQTPNLVYNAGFIGDYKAGLDGWIKEGSDKYYMTNATLYNGNHSGAINMKATVDQWWVLGSKPVTVAQGSKISFSGVSFTGSGSTPTYVGAEIGCYNSAGRHFANAGGVGIPMTKNTWTPFKLENITLPAGTVKISFRYTTHVQPNNQINQYISQPMMVVGEHVTPFKDNQGSGSEVTQINQGLIDTNSKIAAVPHVSAQAAQPSNPKNGDQWWVLDANGKATGFKVWNGTAWADSKIQQSMLNVVSLNAVTVTGSTINGSKFTNNFDYTDLNKINFKGVTEIANGSYKTDFKIAGSNQVGHVYVQPDGLHTYVSGRNGDVSTHQSIDLAFDAISLANGPTFGTLTAADIESTGREVWITSDGVNKPEVGFHKQFRQVWLDGLIALNAASAANPQFLFKLKNSKLYPKASRYISLISLRDKPDTAILRIDLDGSISNISCQVSNMRFVSEGIFYTIGD